MTLTTKIEKAIKRASILHEGQVRKSTKNVPYITHLFSVADLLSTYADKEDVIVAGLLHDTLEDTPYTEEDLESEFGSSIKETVLSVTEVTFYQRSGAIFPWKERKEIYLEKLKTAGADALMVSAADKIDNLEGMIEGYRKNGQSVWESFRGSPEEQIWFFGAVLAILEERLQSDIVQHFRRVFEESKTIFLKE